MSGCCIVAGRLFQILAPATEKLLSRRQMFVVRTVRTLAWAACFNKGPKMIGWKKCMDYGVEGVRPRGRLEKTWSQWCMVSWVEEFFVADAVWIFVSDCNSIVAQYSYITNNFYYVLCFSVTVSWLLTSVRCWKKTSVSRSMTSRRRFRNGQFPWSWVAEISWAVHRLDLEKR